MQPIRAEQAKRGIMLPIDDQKAPVGKIDFIKGLQPFFNAREVEFVKPLPELQAQLLGFPDREDRHSERAGLRAQDAAGSPCL
jgi:hypothetical protein